jgi:hypothetical protein
MIFLVSINQAVYKELSYNLRMEVVQTPEETLRIKSGSCRDFVAIDSRFTPLWISSTICIWLYCTIISRR